MAALPYASILSGLEESVTANEKLDVVTITAITQEKSTVMF